MYNNPCFEIGSKPFGIIKMTNYKIRLKKRHNDINDDFLIIVKTIPAKSKKMAIAAIFNFENINEFDILSCELRL